MKPEELLKEVGNILAQRGKQRDTPDGERSMLACITAFNAITNNDLTETEGWLLLAVLKLVRSRKGEYDVDHYADGIAYLALANESAFTDHTTLGS